VEDSALRMMALISLPCAVGLAVLSGPILQLLCGYEGQDLQVGAGILAVLGITVVFNSLVLTTNAIMQAHGDVKTPVKNMLIGGAVKVAVNYWLVGVADVNILGAAIGTLCCYATITLLNLIAMRRLATGGKLSFMKVLFRPLAAAACMGLVAFFSNRLLLGIVPSAKLVCLVSVAMGGLTYLVLVAVFKAITYDDCILLPKGEKIAKILRIR
jgi:stage V sporulation protein B